MAVFPGLNSRTRESHLFPLHSRSRPCPGGSLTGWVWCLMQSPLSSKDTAQHKHTPTTPASPGFLSCSFRGCLRLLSLFSKNPSSAPIFCLRTVPPLPFRDFPEFLPARVRRTSLICLVPHFTNPHRPPFWFHIRHLPHCHLKVPSATKGGRCSLDVVLPTPIHIKCSQLPGALLSIQT